MNNSKNMLKKNNLYDTLDKISLIDKKYIMAVTDIKTYKTLYEKLMTEEVVMTLGFESLEEFKKRGDFNAEQSKNIKRYLKTLFP